MMSCTPEMDGPQTVTRPGDTTSVIQVKPYAGLASIYDRVMDHVHYGKWSQYIISLFPRFGIPVSSILETACGTGSHTRCLLREGYRVTGTDLSVEMLHIAGEKIVSEGLIAQLVAADMTALPFGGKFDAVLCLYDSINYLCDEALFRKALNEAARVTRPGGVFIFDVCTMKNSQLFFSNHETTESLDGVTYHRTSRYHSSRRIQENSFVIERNSSRITECHIQRIYRLKEINRMLRGTPFEVLAVFDDMSVLPGSEESERVHFVLKRRGERRDGG